MNLKRRGVDMQKSPYAGVINVLMRSESEAGREESRASACNAR